MLDQGVITKMMNGTCAIGYTTVPHPEFIKDVKQPYFKVVGTAFMVRPDLVMTNRHVIQALLATQADLGFTDDQRIIMFVYPKRPGRWNITVSIIQRMGHILNPDVDVGFIGFNPPDDDEFENVQPLVPQQDQVFTVTDRVALCGYPYGHAMLQKEGKVYRWGPIIQQGHISALSPYDNTERPNELLLDVRLAPGMSGAPVIRQEDGTVIGIAHTSWEATTAVAYPIDEALLIEMLTQHDEQAKAA